ncbi:MAG: hypothetical protein R3B06_05900 [Kofleriaceae bacterium]
MSVGAARVVVAAAAVVVAACHGRRPAPAPTDARATAAAPDAIDHPATGPGSQAAAAGVRIPDPSTELVLVVTAGWTATTAQVSHWRRAAGGRWRPVRAPWPATVGAAGLGWGRGLHGDGAPAGEGGPVKAEGDRRAPAGIFALGPVFGVAPAAPPGARVRYTPTTARWRCVDDPASALYTRIVDEDAVVKDWASAEDLRRADHRYDWVVDVRHNPAAAPGGGSCIFLHVWAGPDDATIGCTAMAEPDLRALIATLDPAARPVLVQLPVPAYTALADAWDLPPPP